MFQELKANPFIDSACSTYTVTMGCKPSEADNFLNDFEDACELIYRFTAVSLSAGLGGRACAHVCVPDQRCW
jgi:hypothetical protein